MNFTIHTKLRVLSSCSWKKKFHCGEKNGLKILFFFALFHRRKLAIRLITSYLEEIRKSRTLRKRNFFEVKFLGLDFQISSN